MARENLEKKNLSFKGSTVEVLSWKDEPSGMWPTARAEVKCPKCSKKYTGSCDAGFSTSARQTARRNAVSSLRGHYDKQHKD